MDEEEQNLPVEPAKKRGRKPKNPEIADAEKPAKKRGRPRKIRDGETAESATQAELPEFQGGEQNAADAQNQQSKSLDETLDSEVRKRKSGAGRGAKIPRADGPTWRDTPAPTQSEEPERAEDGGNDESEIFVHSDRSDDFAYTASGADSPESENSADGGDDEIPTSFSTTDEDLDPDAYRNDSDAERRIAEAREYENAAATRATKILTASTTAKTSSNSGATTATTTATKTTGAPTTTATTGKTASKTTTASKARNAGKTSNSGATTATTTASSRNSKSRKSRAGRKTASPIS